MWTKTDMSTPSPVFSAPQHLQQLGAKAAFDKTKADFSRLSPQPLYISDVLQSVRRGLSCLPLPNVTTGAISCVALHSANQGGSKVTVVPSMPAVLLSRHAMA